MSEAIALLKAPFKLRVLTMAKHQACLSPQPPPVPPAPDSSSCPLPLSQAAQQVTLACLHQPGCALPPGLGAGCAPAWPSSSLPSPSEQPSPDYT